MNYQQALDYLYSFMDQASGSVRPPPELNLLRTAALLDGLGNPQHTFASVVIAGTKGKGSTAALTEAIARSSGLRVGLWTSPHLHSYRERIQINRQMISQEALAAAVASVKPLVEELAQGPTGAPTTFAIGFAIALRYFAEQAVDLAVLEVGLGGRYDSANVVTPILSIITSISYDHMDILGDTLAKIAYDKAGILKAGIPAITIAQQPEAIEAIIGVAQETGTPLYIVDQHTTPQPNDLLHPQPAAAPVYIDPYSSYTGPHATQLQGTFQQQNARLAVGAALLLRNAGLPINDTAIERGLQTADWVGRMELVAGEPPVVIDGAHNGDSAHVLIESIRTLFPERQIVLVFGASRNKDMARMLQELLPVVRLWVLTRSTHPRALTGLDELREQIQGLADENRPTTVICEPEPADAIAQARNLAGPNHVICVTGSLFVVAAAREALGLPHEKD